MPPAKKNIYFQSADEAGFFPRSKHSFDEGEYTHRRPSGVMFMHVLRLEKCHITKWLEMWDVLLRILKESEVNSRVTSVFGHFKPRKGSSIEETLFVFSAHN